MCLCVPRDVTDSTRVVGVEGEERVFGFLVVMNGSCKLCCRLSSVFARLGCFSVFAPVASLLLVRSCVVVSMWWS